MLRLRFKGMDGQTGKMCAPGAMQAQVKERERGRRDREVKERV